MQHLEVHKRYVSAFRCPLMSCHFLKRPKIWVGRGPETPNRLRVALCKIRGSQLRIAGSRKQRSQKPVIQTEVIQISYTTHLLRCSQTPHCASLKQEAHAQHDERWCDLTFACGATARRLRSLSYGERSPQSSSSSSSSSNVSSEEAGGGGSGGKVSAPISCEAHQRNVRRQSV